MYIYVYVCVYVCIYMCVRICLFICVLLCHSYVYISSQARRLQKSYLFVQDEINIPSSAAFVTTTKNISSQKFSCYTDVLDIVRGHRSVSLDGIYSMLPFPCSLFFVRAAISENFCDLQLQSVSHPSTNCIIYRCLASHHIVLSDLFARLSMRK